METHWHSFPTILAPRATEGSIISDPFPLLLVVWVSQANLPKGTLDVKGTEVCHSRQFFDCLINPRQGIFLGWDGTLQCSFINDTWAL